MASVLKIITPGEISVLVDWPLSQGEGHKLSAGPLARRWCSTPKTFVYICMKHPILIKVRTADPMWLLYYISVYKSRPWKIKKGTSSWKDWSPHAVLSLSFWLNSHLECGGLSSLLIMPGLLRSDQVGLSVSSPSGEREDACGLCRWCKFLVWNFIGFPHKPSYSASFLHWIFLLSYLYLITLYIFNSIISWLLMLSLLWIPWIHWGWTAYSLFVQL